MSEVLEKIQHVVIGGVKTACVSRAELTQIMIEDCIKRREAEIEPALIFDVNGHGISLAATSLDYKNDLAQADLIHADGGIVVAAAKRLTKRRIADRSATTDVIHDFAKAAEKHGLTFYLLGSDEDENAECYKILMQTYPKLNIIGHRNGYFTETEEVEICREISELKPDIVWVGLGKPKEQRFCVKNKHRIDAGWLITCGGCFHYITGRYARAPMWMQNSGLEWLYRLAADPKRLLWRYLTTNPHALYLIATRSE